MGVWVGWCRVVGVHWCVVDSCAVEGFLLVNTLVAVVVAVAVAVVVVVGLRGQPFLWL
jgi:hypothetical protein